MTSVQVFLTGVWDFVVGDDWRTAIGVVLALGLTALIAETSVSAWWVMPAAVLGLLALSIRRAARSASRRG
jgi:hydrogenase/urease accessory protein HupE